MINDRDNVTDGNRSANFGHEQVESFILYCPWLCKHQAKDEICTSTKRIEFSDHGLGSAPDEISSDRVPGLLIDNIVVYQLAWKYFFQIRYDFLDIDKPLYR